MGPRSENRGYMHNSAGVVGLLSVLQWVHGPRTVVMRVLPAGCRTGSWRGFNGSTVREPWL